MLTLTNQQHTSKFVYVVPHVPVVHLHPGQMILVKFGERNYKLIKEYFLTNNTKEIRYKSSLNERYIPRIYLGCSELICRDLFKQGFLTCIPEVDWDLSRGLCGSKKPNGSHLPFAQIHHFLV